MLNDEINYTKLWLSAKTKTFYWFYHRRRVLKVGVEGNYRSMRDSFPQYGTELFMKNHGKSKTGAAENKKCLQLLMDSILLQIVFLSIHPFNLYANFSYPAWAQTEVGIFL